MFSDKEWLEIAAARERGVSMKAIHEHTKRATKLESFYMAWSRWKKGRK
jgi:hypothetical protein